VQFVVKKNANRSFRGGFCHRPSGPSSDPLDPMDPEDRTLPSGPEDLPLRSGGPSGSEDRSEDRSEDGSEDRPAYGGKPDRLPSGTAFIS